LVTPDSRDSFGGAAVNVHDPSDERFAQIQQMLVELQAEAARAETDPALRQQLATQLDGILRELTGVKAELPLPAQVDRFVSATADP
jgi:hypothetical protein